MELQKTKGSWDGGDQGLLNECRLDYSRLLAARGKLEAAIAVVGKIPENSPLYPKAQKLMKQWLEI